MREQTQPNVQPQRHERPAGGLVSREGRTGASSAAGSGNVRGRTMSPRSQVAAQDSGTAPAAGPGNARGRTMSPRSRVAAQDSGPATAKSRSKSREGSRVNFQQALPPPRAGDAPLDPNDFFENPNLQDNKWVEGWYHMQGMLYPSEDDFQAYFHYNDEDRQWQGQQQQPPPRQVSNSVGHRGPKKPFATTSGRKEGTIWISRTSRLSQERTATRWRLRKN